MARRHPKKNPQLLAVVGAAGLLGIPNPPRKHHPASMWPTLRESIGALHAKWSGVPGAEPQLSQAQMESLMQHLASCRSCAKKAVASGIPEYSIQAYQRPAWKTNPSSARACDPCRTGNHAACHSDMAPGACGCWCCATGTQRYEGSAPVVPRKQRVWLQGKRNPLKTCDPHARPIQPSVAQKLLGKKVRVHLNLHNGCYVISLQGKVVGYTRALGLANVRSKVSKAGHRRCRDEMTRNVHAHLEGHLIDVGDHLLSESPPPGSRAITYNCLTHPPCFFYRDSGECFESAAVAFFGPRGVVVGGGRAESRSKRRNAPTKPSKRNLGPMPKVVGEVDISEFERMFPGSELRQGQDRYGLWHGEEADAGIVIRQDDGKPGTTRKLVVGLGATPKTTYQVPWDGTTKEDHVWEHEHPPGKEPLLVLDPTTNVVSQLPRNPRARIDDFFRDPGHD